MRRLLDWGFARYRNRKLVTDANPIGVVAVGRSGEATVSVRAAESFSLLQTVDEPAATVRLTLPQAVPDSVWRGQTLGVAEVYKAGSCDSRRSRSWQRLPSPIPTRPTRSVP